MSEADVAVLNERIAGVDRQLNAHEQQCERNKEAIFGRLRVIERLIYIGLGGLLAISGIATFFGWNILKLLGK